MAGFSFQNANESYVKNPAPNQLWCLADTIAAADTVKKLITHTPNPGQRARLVHIEFWLDTATLDIIEVYPGSGATITTAFEGGVANKPRLWVPVASANSRYTRTWGIGLGPPSQMAQPWNIRRTTASAGQILYWNCWYTIERFRRT